MLFSVSFKKVHLVSLHLGPREAEMTWSWVLQFCFSLLPDLSPLPDPWPSQEASKLHPLFVLTGARGAGAALCILLLALCNPDVCGDRKITQSLETTWVPMINTSSTQ